MPQAICHIDEFQDQLELCSSLEIGFEGPLESRLIWPYCEIRACFANIMTVQVAEPSLYGRQALQRGSRRGPPS